VRAGARSTAQIGCGGGSDAPEDLCGLRANYHVAQALGEGLGERAVLLGWVPIAQADGRGQADGGDDSRPACEAGPGKDDLPIGSGEGGGGARGSRSLGAADGASAGGSAAAGCGGCDRHHARWTGCGCFHCKRSDTFATSLKRANGSWGLGGLMDGLCLQHWYDNCEEGCKQGRV